MYLILTISYYVCHLTRHSDYIPPGILWLSQTVTCSTADSLCDSFSLVLLSHHAAYSTLVGLWSRHV